MEQEWRKNAVSVTKYDPRFRNSRGQFQKEDWTAISDVGKSFDNQILTLENYLRVESQYVRAAKLFLAHYGCRAVVVRDLEEGIDPSDMVHELLGLKLPQINEGDRCAADQSELLIKACLRGLLWCNLVGEDGAVSIHFGHDYYMYFCPAAMSPELSAQIEESGLFLWKRT